MRSRADLRRGVEWLLRAALVVALAVALWRSMMARSEAGVARRTTVRALPAALREAASAPAVTGLHLAVSETPSPLQRAWLVALRRAGVAVTWSGSPPAIAAEASRAREPRAPARIAVAASAGAKIVVADSAGVVDTLRVGAAGGGALVESDGLISPVTASSGPFAARVALPQAPESRAVLVLGRPSWESKFVIFALGEAGWTVRARLPVAPGVEEATAGLLPLDTSRYDVVVALDSTASGLSAGIARFVAQGGGLVAAGSATRLASLRALLPARAGERLPGRILLEGDSVTPPGLPLRPLASLAADAVVLERVPAGVALAARRAGRAAIVAVGYDESWRWRMLGGASGAASHRAWWSRTVALAAPDRSAAPSPSSGGDAAPLAALVGALGAPVSPPASAASETTNALPVILLVMIVLALVAETASRRFRGAR